MIYFVLKIAGAFAYIMRPFYFWRHRGDSIPSREQNGNISLQHFGDENQIVHVRLSHFSEQIGRWRLPLSMNSRQEGGDNHNGQ